MRSIIIFSFIISGVVFSNCVFIFFFQFTGLFFLFEVWGWVEECSWGFEWFNNQRMRRRRVFKIEVLSLSSLWTNLLGLNFISWIGVPARYDYLILSMSWEIPKDCSSNKTMLVSKTVFVNGLTINVLI